MFQTSSLISKHAKTMCCCQRRTSGALSCRRRRWKPVADTPATAGRRSCPGDKIVGFVAWATAARPRGAGRFAPEPDIYGSRNLVSGAYFRVFRLSEQRRDIEIGGEAIERRAQGRRDRDPHRLPLGD